MAEWGTFSPPNIVLHLPPDIARSLWSRIGGMNQNLLALLLPMSKQQLLVHMHNCIQHCVLLSHHGFVSARVMSVLHGCKHTKLDVVAKDTMVPERDAREAVGAAPPALGLIHQPVQHAHAKDP
jgi:hypothetical protein